MRLVDLPTDDIWVRDYGPFVGLDAAGQPTVASAIYDPLPAYPQTRDHAAPDHWAAHHHLPVRPLDLHTEGGNLWSDGTGTLLMSEDIAGRHQHLAWTKCCAVCMRFSCSTS